MAKFYGNIGFVKTVEIEPGVYEPEESIRPYYGDILYNRRRWATQESSTNDDLKLTNSISILADEFLVENMGFIKWVDFMGSKWKVDTANLVYPRIELTFGGVYNG